jgi:hypothetical protein
MSANLLCIESHYGKRSKLFKAAEKRGDAIVVRQSDLTAKHLENAKGLITSMHLDQPGMMAFSDGLEAFLKRGGRWMFNGHLMRPLVFDLKTYEHVGETGKAALALTSLADHPVFIGVDRAAFGASKGVAGFYGRGSNPMPDGAVALTGVGRKQAPLDWVWSTPGGGQFFSHAGNDLQGSGGTMGDGPSQLMLNILAWVMAEEEQS